MTAYTSNLKQESTQYLSIIIPTKDRKKDLKECLYSGADLDYSKEHIEVIIENNASSDSTDSMIDTIFKENDK